MFDCNASELLHIDEALEPKLAWAKDRQASCEQMALDASRLLSCVEGRLEDYKGQGFFRRCWFGLSGKTGALERANQNDLVEMQKYAWRYINLLQERDLLLAHSVITVKNNLLTLAIAQNEVKNEITRLAGRVYERFVALERRVDNLEVSQAIHSWILTVATYDYDEKYPPYLRLLRVVSDFYTLKPKAWSVVELKYLQKALVEVGLNPKSTVTVSDFVNGLIDEIEHQGFGVFSPLIDPLKTRDLDNGFVIDSVSSPAFNALFQVRSNYTVSSRVIRTLGKKLDINHAEAIKITLNDFIEEQGIDTSANLPLKDLAVEILGCLSLAGRLAEEGASIGAPVSLNENPVQTGMTFKTDDVQAEKKELTDTPSWKNDLIRCLRKYEDSTLYALENIPEKKLKNAIKSFPIDTRDDVIALIDSTIFGSCDTGMAFGVKGIYWKNDWATKSVKNYFSWDDLSALKQKISHKSFDVLFGTDNACSFAASGMGSEAAKNIILHLISLYEDSYAASEKPPSPANA